VDLSTAVEGVIDIVSVRKGDIVEEGQVVAVLESEVERALVAQAKARVEMTSTIRAREVSLARSQEKHERAVKLSSRKFVSPDELDELRSAEDLALLELESERETQKLAEIDLKRAQAQLEEHYIRSPINGVVVQRHLGPGEFAQAQPIVGIAQLDPLNVEAILPGDLHGMVQEGALARVSIPGLQRRTIEAPVTIVEKVIDAASGTFGVRIELPNPGYAIPAGLECSVEIETVAARAAP
jgi:RND family efflux transporter MFP subunit